MGDIRTLANWPTGNWQLARDLSSRLPTIAIVACVTLAGCASEPRQSGSAIPVDLSTLTHWEARGRLGVSGADRGGSGSFAWEQRKDLADVQIRGPIGIGSVHLQVQGSPPNPDLKLETSDGQVFESEMAWNQLEARLGAPVPAGKLRYWMLGLAAPGEHEWISGGSDQISSDETRTLEQDGWRIEYQRYSDEPGTRVPTRINATNGSARVRIVVDRWRLGND